MRIGLLVYDMQDFGGLEEIATSLAIGLQQQGHDACLISGAWVPSNNQYLVRLLKSNGVVFQPPEWISLLASDWSTKERIRATCLWLLLPIAYLLGTLHFLRHRKSWSQSLASVRNWLQGQLMKRLIAPDRREAIMRPLLNWWRFRWRPDILHVHGFTNRNLYAVDWAHEKGVPVLYEEHATPDNRFAGWQGYPKTINKAALIVAVSKQSAQALIDVCGVTQPIRVMEPVVADPFSWGWRRTNGRCDPNKAARIVTIARLHVAKGLTDLLEAMVLVKATHSDAQFRVYGDGALRNELLAQAKELGLDGEAIFVGPFANREELAHIMAQTDVLVMSSISEGQPLVVIEAMSYGCAIVSTSVGGIPEIIEDGVNGLLCIPNSPECLAEKISALIDDPSLRASLGSAARKTYEQGPFQPTRSCERYVSVYREVLETVSRKGGHDRGAFMIYDN